jgi:hypothetical protein
LHTPSHVSLSPLFLSLIDFLFHRLVVGFLCFEKQVDEMSTRGDFEAVKKDIAKLLHQPEYDDGSAGPVLVRLAWYVFHLGLHLTIPIINLRTPPQILTLS